MKKNIFILYFLPFAIIILSCVNSQFDQFKNNFRNLKIPFSTSDSIDFIDWPSRDFIDATYIKEYQLLEKFIDKKYPFKKLESYQCSYFGKFDSRNFTVLAYKSYTTEAGRGNPIIVLATFSKAGEKKDNIIALWNDAEDPLYNQRVLLDILTTSKIIIRSIVTVNGYLDGQVVPKRITEKSFIYSIDDEGKILKEKETSKIVFSNNNPKILDDFPQK